MVFVMHPRWLAANTVRVHVVGSYYANTARCTAHIMTKFPKTLTEEIKSIQSSSRKLWSDDSTWHDNIKTGHTEIGVLDELLDGFCENVNIKMGHKETNICRIYFLEESSECLCEHGNVISVCVKVGNVFTRLVTVSLSVKLLLYRINYTASFLAWKTCWCGFPLRQAFPLKEAKFSNIRKSHYKLRMLQTGWRLKSSTKDALWIHY